MPQDWWEPCFGGRCVVLEYAPGLGYHQYVPSHSLSCSILHALGQVLPLVIPLTYFFLLPRRSAFLDTLSDSAYDDNLSPVPTTSLPYTPLAAEDEAGEEEGSLPSGPKRGVSLSASDKWRIVQPLLMRYMLPLCKFPLGITENQLTNILH